MYSAAAANPLNGFAHSFSISSLMNAAAAASSAAAASDSTSSKQFDLNSYSQMYGAAATGANSAANSSNSAAANSGASGPNTDYYAMYNQQANI